MKKQKKIKKTTKPKNVSKAASARANNKPAPVKTKPKAVKSKEAAPVKKARTVKPAPDGEIMDRGKLKDIASQLKEAGSSVKVLKSDTDEQLQKKINEALQQLPGPAVIKKLESIEPGKLVTVLKKDCIGVFINLDDVSCMRCVSVTACAKEFINNLRGEFKVVDAALPDPVANPGKKSKTSKTDEAEEAANEARAEHERDKASPGGAFKSVLEYDADRLVVTRDQPNPNKRGDAHYDTLQAILDEAPSTLGELREIVERGFDVDSDADFMEFVTNLREPVEGIIKLDVDLTKKDKAALRKAGLDV